MVNEDYEVRRKIKQTETQFTLPNIWKDCCKKAWGKYTIEEKFVSTRMNRPIVFVFCPECGTQIRPQKKCCQFSVRHEFKHCYECGESLSNFLVKEESNANR